MVIIYIILGVLALGIAILLLRIALTIIATAIGTSLFVGMVCGIFYLLDWMEGDTVKNCMQWAFVIGIPMGIWYVIKNPEEAISDESSSFTPQKYTGYDEYGHYIELEQFSRYNDYDYWDPKTGRHYEKDTSGNFRPC